MRFSLSFLSLVFISSSALANRPSAGPDQLKQLFSQRLQLREQFVPGSLSATDAVALKAQITDIRYDEDRLGEALIDNQRRPVEEKSPALFGNEQSVLLNPAFANLTFQSGDVIIMRGMSTISTTIASVSDAPSTFSHSLTMYLNPADQTMYVIEAIMGKGVIVRTLSEVLNEGVPRAVLYRHKNAALANAAAKIDFDKAMAAIQAGQNIPYAKNLAFDGYDEITCAKLVRMGFDLASNGAVKMPSFPSTLGKKYPNIASALGFPKMVIPVEWPADFDAEKDLQLVAESRDFKATLNFRIKDQIVLTLLDWVEAGIVGHDFSKMIAGMNAPKDPNAKNSPDDSMKKMTAFADKANDVVNALTKEILKENDRQLQKTHLNMADEDIRAYMEAVRETPAVQKILKAYGFAPKPASCSQALM